jgi:hypothetical protein
MFPFQSERNPSCEGDKNGGGGEGCSSGEVGRCEGGRRVSGTSLRETAGNPCPASPHFTSWRREGHTSFNIVRTDDMIDTRSLCTWNRILTLSKGATTVFAVAPAMPERAAREFLFSLWVADLLKPTVAQSIAGDALRGAEGMTTSGRQRFDRGPGHELCEGSVQRALLWHGSLASCRRG